jgi:hypothetical protein
MPAAPPSLATKLGIRPGMLVALLDPPPAVGRAIRDGAPSGVRWRKSIGSSRFDLIFFWPVDTTRLSRDFARLQASLVPDGAIWVVMPKKAYAAARQVSFRWEEMQAEGLRGDLVDNKIAAITATDYGTRFVIRKERRPR